MTPIYAYLQHGMFLDNPNEARKVKIKAHQFIIKSDQLYRRGSLMPWLKCITTTEEIQVLNETHKGDVGAHEGTRTLTGKMLHMGIYFQHCIKKQKKSQENVYNARLSRRSNGYHP